MVIGEGYINLTQARISRNLSPGQTVKDVVDAIVDNMPGVARGPIVGINLNSPIIHGWRLNSNTAAVQTYDNRMKDVQDAVFVPGLAPFTVSQNQMNNLTLGSDPNDLLIVHNVGTGQETHLTLKADGNAEVQSQFTVKVIGKDIELTASNSLTLSAQQMNINVSQANWTGSYTMIGEARFNGVLFDTHFHNGVTPGAGNSGPVAG